MKKWLDPNPVSVPDALQNAIGGHPLIAQHLVRRGITNVAQAQQFLSPDNYHPTSPDALPDMDKAVTRLQKAIKQGEQILVWGDFDVDGQTSTALLVDGLRDLGAKVHYHIPNRFKEGHGIHLPTLKTLLNDVDILLTCDTGITAHESVTYAMQYSVDVIITDHHSLAETLPDAYAIINPMRLSEGHPLRELPGVGTAYKLMQALYNNQSSEHLLDLVAMGIVADVMVQIDDTRYLLQKGLDVLRNSPRAGLLAMMQRADINPQDLTETDIGFSLAPRLNALGRLADANPAVELLTTSDSTIITEGINELEGLNQKRKYLTKQVYAATQQQIRNDDSLLKYSTLVLAGEAWHTGVVGIVASRLAEDYNCPVIVLSENDGILRGSARSVDGANIVEAIRSQGHLLKGYGGHNMAAGLSMDADNLFEFRRGISGIVREMLNTTEVDPKLRIDAYLNFSEIDLPFADNIARLAPFGNGNPPLTLATKNVHIKSRRTMGSRGDHLDLRLADDSGNEQRVVWWFGDINQLPEGKFDIAYTVRANVFKGKREAMVEWLDARPAQGEIINITPQKRYTVLDYRDDNQPEKHLQQTQSQYPEHLVWSDEKTDFTSVNRYQLELASTLIVWTQPSDIITWTTALNVVQPQNIVLLGVPPRITTPKQLISEIIGMAKYAIKNKAGIIYLQEIVGRTNQPDLAVLSAIKWINANTEMTLHREDDDLFYIRMNTEKSEDVDLKQLSLIMRETTAYRKHWMNQIF
ncbi:MAG: single-stranded-DNA-specific exonuclease RecJ [Chloroflexota bacterium]